MEKTFKNKQKEEGVYFYHTPAPLLNFFPSLSFFLNKQQ
jgi:hypothetical protein